MTRQSDALPRTTSRGIVLRPRSVILRSGVLTTTAVMLPVFGVAYLLTWSSNLWQAVLAAQLVATAVALLAGGLFLRSSIEVRDGAIVERPYFGRTTVIRLDRVRSALVAQMLGDDAASDLPQLFLRDAEGRLLLRMHGRTWAEEHIEAVAAATGVNVERTDPVSPAELRAEVPELLWWFERRPVLTVVIAVFGVTGLAVLAAELLVLI